MRVANSLEFLKDFTFRVFFGVQEASDGSFESLELREFVVGVGESALDTGEFFAEILEGVNWGKLEDLKIEGFFQKAFVYILMTFYQLHKSNLICTL